MPPTVPWRTEAEPAPAAGLHWRIGPLDLGAARTEAEWLVWWRHDADPMDTSVAFESGGPATPPEDAAAVRRFAWNGSAGTLALHPLTADRPVVCRPEHPLAVPAGQRATLFVSTPVWVQVSAGGTKLVAMPVFRPSDTWFGPNTREGELCYASRTQARLRLDDLPRRPHRAVTTVVVENASATPLEISRLRLPTPNLHLYQDGHGQLWTDRCALRREADDEFAALTVAGTAPPEAGPEAAQVAAPRVAWREGVVTRAFGRLATLIGGGD